jgi:hypothetical protein
MLAFFFLQLRNDRLSFGEIGDGWLSLLASWRCLHVLAEEHGMEVNSLLFLLLSPPPSLFSLPPLSLLFPKI